MPNNRTLEMPPKATWMTRVPEAIAEVRASAQPVWWTSHVAALLGLKRTQAVALMSRFGAERRGRALEISRTELLRGLEAAQAAGRVRPQAKGRAPGWLLRVPAAISQLESLPAETPLSTGDLATLLGLSSGRAYELARHWGAGVRGRDLCLPVASVLDRLAEVADSQAFGEEIDRQRALRRRLSTAEDLRIPLEPGHRRVRTLHGLPPGITIEPGRIEIVAESPKELLGNLVALAEALTHDLGAFAAVQRGWEDAVRPPQPARSVPAISLPSPTEAEAEEQGPLVALPDASGLGAVARRLIRR
jgi:hypothetical protein